MQISVILFIHLFIGVVFSKALEKAASQGKMGLEPHLKGMDYGVIQSDDLNGFELERNLPEKEKLEDILVLIPSIVSFCETLSDALIKVREKVVIL